MHHKCTRQGGIPAHEAEAACKNIKQSLPRAGFAVIMPRVGRVLRLTVLLLRGALQCEIEHAAIVQSPLFTSATSFNKEWCT